VILSRWTRWTAVAVFVAVPVGVATKAHANTFEATEVRRIRAHFDSVLVELDRRDLGRLSREQRSHRAALVSELRQYRDRGVFPHNYDFPDQATPYFVDRKTGTLCAVANLLAVSGRRDIVDRVARTNNNVWVDDLSADTAFTRWLDANGLTLGEAARIQVPYVAPVSNAEIARQVSFVIAAPLSVIGSTAMTLWNITGNADGHRGGVAWTGMITGAMGVTSGALLVTKAPDVQAKFGQIGSVAIGIGLTSMLTSGLAMHQHRVIVAAQRDSTRRSVVTEASVSPVVMPNGGAGLGMTLRF
jgi:hypothetical protein